MMNISDKIDCLSHLGAQLTEDLQSGAITDTMVLASNKNPWFTLDNIQKALKSIAREFLNRDHLSDLADQYSLNGTKSKRVGLVLAGNIPAVGLHDILCAFLCNHISIIKYSSKDDVLIPTLLEKLVDINQAAAPYFEKVEKLVDFDAVIATGGNNTSKYFEYYFRNVKHIIRKSRSSIAVLGGNETDSDLMNLGDDITSYFGLGCRNVSQVLVPRDYELPRLLSVMEAFDDLSNHHKYRNNFDYNMALFLLNKETFLNNGCLLLKEDEQIASRIACLHYQRYHSDVDLIHYLDHNKDSIQCVVSNKSIKGYDCVPFGKAQQPSLMDYADGVDTIQFLLSI
ncbi:MAG: acyl-CoA reductase [Saprospiraceae bacterium]|nr:acyl-CoA reductase [Saprospiraceae bacterium]